MKPFFNSALLAIVLLASLRPSIVHSQDISKIASTGRQLFSLIKTAPASEAPSISSFSPTQGRPGASVELQGQNITNALSVRFGTATASFSVFQNAIVAQVPTNAVTAPITIETPAGSVTTDSPFTVTALAAPTITSFSPTSGEVGKPVEILGTNFESIESVKFNGVSSTFSIGNGTIITKVPAGATTGFITVTTAGGTGTSATAFTVVEIGAPVITELSPSSGAPGTSIEIKGTNLLNATTVQFNGATASFLAFGASLRATVPTNATTGPITVVTSAGTATSPGTFTVLAGTPPTVTSFTPAEGGFGAVVELRGTFLRDVLSVKFNDLEAVFTNSLFRPLSAVVPTNAISGPITVTTKGGTFVTTNFFTVVNPEGPTITSINSTNAAGGTLIEVRGSNLLEVKSVHFAGAAASFIEFPASNGARLFTTVPTNAAPGKITVITAKGRAVSEQVFFPENSPDPEPPTLSIRLASETQIELTWPATADLFAIESAESIGSAGSWTRTETPPAIADGKATVLINTDQGQRFYRLITK